MKKKICEQLKKKKVWLSFAFITVVTKILASPICAYADGTEYGSTKVNPTNVANTVKTVMTNIASAIGAGIGIYLCISSIQEFATARDSHDTGTMIKSVSKIVSGVICLLAGGIAFWFTNIK